MAGRKEWFRGASEPTQKIKVDFPSFPSQKAELRTAVSEKQAVREVRPKPRAGDHEVLQAALVQGGGGGPGRPESCRA